MRLSAPALGMLVVASWLSQPAHTEDQANSTTVLGPSNTLLADGAAALEDGHIEEGLRLTLEGLKAPSPTRDTAAGHANACAGFVLLQQWEDALDHCNKALGLDTSNWRAYNNRAAVYVAKGLYELAVRDIEAGLQIAPQSRTLHESMRIVLKNKRIIGNRGRRSVPS
jgi:tetratricopeptide (TPR) repeat protein